MNIKTYHFTKAWRVLQGVSDINEGPSLVLLTAPDVGKLDGQVLDVGAKVLDRLQSVREITEQKSSSEFTRIFNTNFANLYNTKS